MLPPVHGPPACGNVVFASTFPQDHSFDFCRAYSKGYNMIHITIILQLTGSFNKFAECDAFVGYQIALCGLRTSDNRASFGHQVNEGEELERRVQLEKRPGARAQGSSAERWLEGMPQHHIFHFPAHPRQACTACVIYPLSMESCDS